MPRPISARRADKLKGVSAWENYRRDIGGEFIGSNRAFTYFVPIAWLLSMLGYEAAEDPAVFGLRMLANGLAFAACFGILYLFRKTIFRDRYRRTISVFVVIAAGLFLGAAKVSITAGLMAGMTQNAGELDSLLVRILAGAVTGAWYLPTSAIVLATQDRYRTVRDGLFAARLMKAESTPGSVLVDPAQVKLAEILKQLRETIDQQRQQPAVLAKSLSTLLEKRIRPFSRSLWSKSGRKQNDSSPIELAGIVLARNVFWPSLTTVAILLASAPLIISTVGWLEGFGRLTVLGSVSLLTLSGLRKIRPGKAVRGILVFSLGALFYSISNELIASLLFGPFGSLSATFAVLLNAGVFAILSTLIGLLRLTRDELQELEKELDNILGVNNFIGRMDLERARLRQRELAKIVHGRLQNQILGAVLALTKSPEKDSPEKLLQEIERLEMEVGASTEPKQSPVSASLSEEFSALTDRWRGLVNVKVSSDLALDLTPQDVSACVLVAEEAITNAVRHGLASSIDIAIVPALHNWAITITDNGVGPRNGRPSLGTLTLNQIAGESWSLVANGSGVGSILTVQIPKYQSESKIV